MAIIPDLSPKPEKPVINTYATPGIYSVSARCLAGSLGRFGHGLEVITSSENDWKRVVMMKPLLLSILAQAPDGWQQVLVDADSVFWRPPPWDEIRPETDLAFCRFKRHASWSDEEAECLTGTIYIKASQKVREFIDRWFLLTPACAGSDTPEQVSLRMALQQDKSGLKVQHLSPEWCWIEDAMRSQWPDAKPILWQRQLSRITRTK